MTPEQRARLVVLIAAMAATSITASEKQELTFLKSIASKKELSAAESMAETSEEDETEESDDTGSEEEEENDDDTPAPTTGDQVKAMVSSRAKLVQRNRELSKMLGEIKAENQQNSTELAKLKTDHEKATTELDTVKAALGEAKEKAKTVSQETTDELAGLGVKEKDLPASTNKEKATPTTDEELAEQLKGIEDPDERLRLVQEYDDKQAA